MDLLSLLTCPPYTICLFLLFVFFSPAPTFWPSSPAGTWCWAVLWRCPARVGWVGWAWRHVTWCAPPASRGPCTVWRKALAAGARTPRHWQATRSGAPAWAPRWWPSWGCRSGAKAHSNSTSKVSPIQNFLILPTLTSCRIRSTVCWNLFISQCFFFFFAVIVFMQIEYLKNTWSPLGSKKHRPAI